MGLNDENLGVPSQEKITIDNISAGPAVQSQENNSSLLNQVEQPIGKQNTISTFIMKVILWAIPLLLVSFAIPPLYGFFVNEVFSDISYYFTAGLFIFSLTIIIFIEYYRIIKPALVWENYKVFLQSFYLSLIISPIETLAVKGYFLNTSSSVVLILLIINTILFLIVGNYFGRADDRADKQLTIEGVSEKVSINKVQAMHSQLKTFGIAVAIAVILIVIGMLLFGYLLKYVGEHPNQ